MCVCVCMAVCGCVCECVCCERDILILKTNAEALMRLQWVVKKMNVLMATETGFYLKSFPVNNI